MPVSSDPPDREFSSDSLEENPSVWRPVPGSEYPELLGRLHPSQLDWTPDVLPASSYTTAHIAPLWSTEGFVYEDNLGRSSQRFNNLPCGFNSWPSGSPNPVSYPSTSCASSYTTAYSASTEGFVYEDNLGGSSQRFNNLPHGFNNLPCGFNSWPSGLPNPVSYPSTSCASSSSRPHRLDPSAGTKQCYHCHATTTPLWRRDPMTHRTLCNACGLYLQQRHALRPQELIDADTDEESEGSVGAPDGPECSHCHTRQTSVWRRSKEGDQVCNACGVYERLRGKTRPLSLQRNKIKPRVKHAQH
ncbi:hypothetical protein FB451DRAFT_1028999 [Mycena latifolia]|nr:hypothetical protein FB451DRAFT_1028999 [Mycena latifolia]